MSGLSVSVVIPTYNRAPLLGRALNSAVCECLPGDEVLVVDDGSTDETEAICGAFGPPVRYITGEHRGAGAARNAGIREAKGDLVAFLDSDDEWIDGKLSWQRAVLEQFPDILFVFSDFGIVRTNGERLSHQLSTWVNGADTWDERLGLGIASTDITGIPPSAPSFKLRVGRVYETLIRDWCVCTCTVVVRRIEAGDALHFAEDVPTFEDLECFARLASRGLAGYMDCDTLWNHGHEGKRLTGTDPVTKADVAVKITGRIWGTDDEYLRLHRGEFEKVSDRHRARKVRYLLSEGRHKEARRELSQFFHRPWLYALLSRLPRKLLRCLLALRRGIRSAASVGRS